MMGRILFLGTILVGCGGLEGSSGEPELVVNPLEIDFGSAPVDAPTSADLTLTNQGGGTITVLSLTLTSGDPDVFSVDRSGVQEIGAGESGVVSVIIRPEEEGRQYTGAIQLRTDAPDGNRTVTLRGMGGESGADNDGDGFSPADGDCDDDNDQVFPGALEVCDGADNDCDGNRLPDEVDRDDDGWLVCEGDCDDDDDDVNPGMDELCDEAGKDNDCDETTNERIDGDGDGFTICDGDCDDDEPRATTEDAIEVCDGVDNNCDGGIDDIDADGDGVSVCTPQGVCDPNDVTAACDCDDNDPEAFPVVVAPNGDDEGLGTDADPFETIEHALANLDQVCRRVVLQAGAYSDVAASIAGETVTIAGKTGDPTDVTLEAAADQPHLRITGGAEVFLANLTLTGGDVPEDGGAIQVETANLTLADVVADGNRSGDDGGAIAMTSGTLTIEAGCAFTNNTAGDDAGALNLETASLVDSSGTLYEGNVAAAQGGAIRMLAPSGVVLGNALFVDNEGAEGGAIHFTGATPNATLQSNRFWRNTAVTGGAIATRGFVPAAGAVNRNRFQDNAATGGEGGALAVLGSNGDPSAFVFHNNTLSGNESGTFDGAAIAVIAPADDGLVITSNVLLGNDGASALYVAPTSTTVVTYNTAFLTNTAVHFGGAVGDGNGGPLDPTNAVENPDLQQFSGDGNPNNDTLTPQAGSPVIDSGNPDPAFNDASDDSVNDRGYTGGPINL